MESTVQQDDLLKNLQFTKSAVIALEEMHHDINMYNKRLIRIHPAWYALACPFIIVWMMVKIERDIYRFQNYFDILVGLLVCFLLFIGFCCLIYLLNNWFVRYKYIKNANRVREIQEDYPLIFDDLRTYSMIPEAYWNSAALSVMEGYLINKRADTLKECLNLYESERFQHASIAYLEDIKRLQAISVFFD